MFCVVRLKRSKQILVINKNWILNFDVIKFHNQGLKVNKKQIIYYSAINNAVADFRLPVSELFQPHMASLYEANLVKFYGMGAIFPFYWKRIQCIIF